MLLDVPVLKVDEINLEVDDLQARVSLHAQVLDLLQLHVGADVSLGRVSLGIKGVEAAALLKVRLDNVAAILDRVMTTLDENPQMLGELSRGLGGAVGEIGRGSGQALTEVGEGAGGAVEQVGQGAGGAVEQVGQDAGAAVEQVGEGAASSAGSVGEAAGKLGRGANGGAAHLAEDSGTAATGRDRSAQRTPPPRRRAPSSRADRRR